MTSIRELHCISMKTAILLLAALSLGGCGMGKAASDTGKMFDKYGCIARDFKGQPPCEQPEP